MPRYDFILPIDLKNSNDGQMRLHFGATAKLRKSYRDILAKLRLKGLKPDHPQRLTLTRILGKGQRLWDADSVLRGSAKQLVDALVEAGFFIDDKPQYLPIVDGRQDPDHRKSGPAVRVTIRAVGDVDLHPDVERLCQAIEAGEFSCDGVSPEALTRAVEVLRNGS